MERPKRLAASSLAYLNSLSSGATISNLNPDKLGEFSRKQHDQQYVADIISGDRREFSKEYISPDKHGREILKSDAFQRVGDIMYLHKGKKYYAHHHITDSQEIDTRLESIIDMSEE